MPTPIKPLAQTRSDPLFWRKGLALPVLAFAGLSLLAACGSQPSPSGDASSNADTASMAMDSATVTPADALTPVPSLASLPDPFNNADYANGKSKYNQCIACHALSDGKNGMGPSLYHVIDSPAGEVEGFAYSEALKGSNFIWDSKTLDQWIENPAKLLPGSKMNYAGMRNADDRRDLIAYLMVETGVK